MRTILRTGFLAILLGICVFASAQGWEWAKRMGGNQLDEIERVTVDKEGNILVVGKFSGSFMYENFPMNSSGSKNIYVAKYAADGLLLWVQSAGGIGLDEGLCIGTDKDNNVLISGFFTGQAAFDTVVVQGHASDEIFVAKYDPLGNFLWVRTAGGPGNDRGKGIDADTKGNVLVTGYYYDTCNFGNTTLVSPGLDNIFLAKYSPDGNLLWVADGGGTYSAWASSVSTDADDNAYITGSIKGTAVFGNHSITSYGGNDVFLARADSSGTWTLAVHGGGLSDDYGNGIQVDGKNHIAVTGSFFQTVLFGPTPTLTTNGDKDGFVAYYDPQGNCLWARNMGGPGSDKGIDVSYDKDGNIYVAGHIFGSSLFDTISLVGNGSDEIFLAKYRPGGEIVYAVLAGGTSSDFGKGMEVDIQGVAYVGGFFQGSATFGSYTLTSAGDRDSFVAKYYDGSPVFTMHPISTEVCVDNSVTLAVSVNGPGTFDYLWFDDAGSIMGAVNSSYTFVCTDTSFSGKYYCIVSNAYASVTSDTALLTVYPLPELQLIVPDTLFSSDTLVVNAGSGYASYLWSTGDTTEFIVLYPQMIGTGLKTISVTVTDDNGCVASASAQILIIDVGIPESSQQAGFEVFPNPARDEIYVISNSQKILEINIYNISGQIMKMIHDESQDPIVKRIPITDLPQGVYFMRIHTPNGMFAYKFVVQP